ncbi:MAG: 5-methylcytosine-specific restriction endonuclease system specificity protein McrC [Firmicutes bacterium]|nr:5-methylcytosine-specific restriction endonuclease system specificity protein McrC [Bacillota bacterium]
MLTHSQDKNESGLVGRIPVRNLWLLMLYASHLYRDVSTSRTAVEDNPDDIPDLVAEILTRSVERRLRRNLCFGYRSKTDVLSRVRGRVDLLATERKQLLNRGKVACRYEELTVDTPRNRYVRAALLQLMKIVRRKDLAHRCRSLAGSLGQLGVAGEKPARAQMSANRFGRHDLEDQQMVVAARLAFDLALPTEEKGAMHLPVPEREIAWVRKLFEKAVAGFYDVVLAHTGWRVEAGKTMDWLIESKTAGMDSILPSMRTDIILEHVQKGRRIIIDTKFNSIVTRGLYRDQTLRSGHIYQIYAYLRSQVGCGDPLADSASGLLLHPSVGEMMDETVVIQGHEIRVATVDLAAEASEIRKQLLNVAGLAGTTD